MAVAEGADASFWNPAGLATFTGTQFTATHTETYEHLRHEQVAVAGRRFGGGMAASLRAMYSEPIPERDDLGNLMSCSWHKLNFPTERPVCTVGSLLSYLVVGYASLKPISALHYRTFGPT